MVSTTVSNRHIRAKCHKRKNWIDIYIFNDELNHSAQTEVDSEMPRRSSRLKVETLCCKFSGPLFIFNMSLGDFFRNNLVFCYNRYH